MEAIKTVKEADLKDKVVLIRTDYNVPLDGKKILDNTRIRESIENIRYILDGGAKKIVIVTHLGRPLGSVVDELRLKPIVLELESLLGEEVSYFEEGLDNIDRKMVDISTNRVICLENIRFDRREEEGDNKFAESLSKLADLFVLDGFSVAHRAHASVTQVAKFIPAYAGLGFTKEIEGIDGFLSSLKKPFWGFFGGIKLDDKIPVIQVLAPSLDGVVFGSSIAVAFLKKFGFGTGDSLVSSNSEKTVSEFLEFSQKNNLKFELPKDLIIGDSVNFKIKKVFEVDFEKVIKGEIKPFQVCEFGEAIYDIGEKSLNHYVQIMTNSSSVFWNGPFGYVEKNEFATGTNKLAKILANSSAKSLVGGGDTVGVITGLGMILDFDYVSSSGGSMMEFIANGTLPGIDILKR